MIGPTPANPYNQIIVEHLPYGADTPHNLVPMDLHPTQKFNGVARPPRLIDKFNPRTIVPSVRSLFSGYAPFRSAQPTTLK